WHEGREVIVTLHGANHGSNRYALIHTGGRDGDANNWLIHLMKPARDQAPRTARADARRRVTPSPKTDPSHSLPAPMLASPGVETELAHTEDWAFEMKWDGIRAIAEVKDGAVRIASRNGIDLTATYPEVQELASSVNADVIVDGEIVALNRAGRPEFGVLQKRMNLSKPGEVERARASVPVHFMVFDVLELGGERLTARPYRERREILERTVRPGGAIQLPPVFEGDISAAMETSRELGLEGVLAKRRDSKYSPGRRVRSWLKLKHQRTQEVVIGGWRPGSGSRANRVGSLLMGIPTGDALVYVGRVGSGFSERELDALAPRLRKLERKTSPFAALPPADAADAHFVTPTLVGEVEFSEWTPTQKLRHPSWRGWRPDKSPADVQREAP
ncbi:MAG: ATP-dependent DNA ligase, partial [Salinibacterium sp.]